MKDWEVKTERKREMWCEGGEICQRLGAGELYLELSVVLLGASSHLFSGHSPLLAPAPGWRGERGQRERPGQSGLGTARCLKGECFGAEVGCGGLL